MTFSEMPSSRVMGHAASWFLAVILAAGLAGCASSPRFTTRPQPVGGGAVKGGFSLLESGVASYYADEFHGRLTASGERYDMHALTAAHRTLPFGTRVRVTNLTNEKSIEVRINDRGPFKDNRVIDLSLAAAKKVGLIAPGSAKVQIEVLELGSGKMGR